ncbi:MAG TPA: cytidine deaminase [Sphingobium sp.]|nr:cytidine deaminase [Sphingobium sp.]
MSADEDKVGTLVSAARAAMAHAHAPYSRFAVGAAVRLTDGEIIAGANFENASYGLSLCAETVALAAANAGGRLADVEALAVAGGPLDQQTDAVVTPCGRCRQILNEAEQVAGRPILIYCAAPTGDAVVEHRLSELLPFAFGPNDLGHNSDRKN